MIVDVPSGRAKATVRMGDGQDAALTSNRRGVLHRKKENPPVQLHVRRRAREDDDEVPREGNSPIIPSTPLWPRMKPKRRNIKILRTLRVVGTKTPAKVPSLAGASVPEERRLRLRCPLGGATEAARDAGALVTKALPRANKAETEPKGLFSREALTGRPRRAPAASSGSLSSWADSCERDHRRWSWCESSWAARVVKFEREWSRGGIRDDPPPEVIASLVVVIVGEAASRAARWL